MGKVRDILDGKIFFVKVTLVLQDGRTLTAIDDTGITDIDANWQVYLSRAKEKWGSRIDTFEVVQLSKHDPQVKEYVKGKNINMPSREMEEQKESFGELRLGG